MSVAVESTSVLSAKLFIKSSRVVVGLPATSTLPSTLVPVVPVVPVVVAAVPVSVAVESTSVLSAKLFIKSSRVVVGLPATSTLSSTLVPVVAVVAGTGVVSVAVESTSVLSARLLIKSSAVVAVPVVSTGAKDVSVVPVVPVVAAGVPVSSVVANEPSVGVSEFLTWLTMSARSSAVKSAVPVVKILSNTEFPVVVVAGVPVSARVVVAGVVVAGVVAAVVFTVAGAVVSTALVPKSSSPPVPVPATDTVPNWFTVLSVPVIPSSSPKPASKSTSGVVSSTSL